MIARVGYDPDLLHLRAVMRDGSGYDVAPCMEDEFAAFMAASSKGSHWHKVFAARAYRSSEGKERGADYQAGADTGGTNTPPVLRLREPQALHTFEHDDCCGPSLARALRSGDMATAESWTCPNCGEEWKPRTVGQARHWEPHPAVMMIDPGINLAARRR